MPSTVTLIALTAGALRCDSCTLNETRSSSPSGTMSHSTPHKTAGEGGGGGGGGAYKNIGARKSSPGGLKSLPRVCVTPRTSVCTAKDPDRSAAEIPS